MLLEKFQIQNGRFIHYHFVDNKKPILIFLNGLSDSLKSWVNIVELFESEYSYLFVDLIGQGASLDYELNPNNQSGVELNYKITIEQQAKCLVDLIDHLKINKFSLVGFSYGGGIALQTAQLRPQQIERFILIAPFLLRLDLAFPLSRLWVWYYKTLKKMTPLFFKIPFKIFEKNYAHFVHHYMDYRFSGRITEVERRKIAIELSEGIMRFNVFQLLEQAKFEKMQLVSCELDTLIPKSLMMEFWYRCHNDQKLSWTQIQDGEHLLLEQNPYFVAKLIEQLLIEAEFSDRNEKELNKNTHESLSSRLNRDTKPTIRMYDTHRFGEFKRSSEVFHAQI